jgi:hypothetical protein
VRISDQFLKKYKHGVRSAQRGRKRDESPSF